MANIVMYYFGGYKFGMGHWYRSTVLARELSKRGHRVCIAGNKDPMIPNVAFYGVSYGDKLNFERVLQNCHPSVVVSDVPNETPSFLFSDEFVLVSIDGVGVPSNGGVTISQGIDGAYEYQAPDYLIIDEKFYTGEYVDRRYDWFVFGGYYDKMGLAKLFASTNHNLSCVVSNDIGQCTSCDIYRMPVDTGILARTASRAVVAMGMIVWELLAIGIKPHVFSLTERHLSTALEMQRRGWVNAYGDVGVPSKPEFESFILNGRNTLGKPVVNKNSLLNVIKLIESMP